MSRGTGAVSRGGADPGGGADPRDGALPISGAVSTGAPVRAIGPAGAHPALGRRARDLTTWMSHVRRAEAVYARYHVDLSRDGVSLWRTLTASRRRREAALAFDDLVRSVCGLRTSWDLLRLRAAAEGLTGHTALRRTLPGLFEGAGGSDGSLRSDTTFSYAAARSAGDIAACLRWRLERGHC